MPHVRAKMYRMPCLLHSISAISIERFLSWLYILKVCKVAIAPAGSWLGLELVLEFG